MAAVETVMKEMPYLGDQPHGDVLQVCTLAGFRILAKYSHPEVGFQPEIMEVLVDRVDAIRSQTQQSMHHSAELLQLHQLLQQSSIPQNGSRVSDLVHMYHRRFHWIRKRDPADQEILHIRCIAQAMQAIEDASEPQRIDDVMFLVAKHRIRKLMKKKPTDD